MNRWNVRIGLAILSALAVAATGCRAQVVHQTRTVYVPAPPPVAHVPPAPAPQPPPPVMVVTPPASAPVVVIQTESDFYEPLESHGRWVVVAGHGRCWVPARVEAGWRPYSNGHWQRTDAGWYWASDEPWGWATYHYGRWDFHATHGWYWVPRTQWAPAWVCWREGGGYVGWAPLHPTVRIGVNLHVGDYEPAHASRAYVFVEQRRMLEPVRPKTVIVNNTTIINQTVNITKVKVVNQTVINEGPRTEVIEHASGRKVPAVAASEFRHREETVVATRERHIPTAKERKPQRVVHTALPAAPAPGSTTRNSPAVESQAVVEKPAAAATQAASLITRTPPVRSSVDQSATRPDGARNPATVKTRRPVQVVESKAAATVPPAPSKPVTAATPHHNTTESKYAITMPAEQPRPGGEVRSAAKREARPVKVESAPSAARPQPSTPVVAEPTPKRHETPNEKARATERAEKSQPKKGKPAKNAAKNAAPGTENSATNSTAQPRSEFAKE